MQIKQKLKLEFCSMSRGVASRRSRGLGLLTLQPHNMTGNSTDTSHVARKDLKMLLQVCHAGFSVNDVGPYSAMARAIP